MMMRLMDLKRLIDRRRGIPNSVLNPARGADRRITSRSPLEASQLLSLLGRAWLTWQTGEETPVVEGNQAVAQCLFDSVAVVA